MKLRFSGTSPFVRKVVIQALETGLDSKIERVTTATTDPALAKENPLSKVPSLTLDDGSHLYDSPVICEYLDSLHGGAKMFPAAGPARWTALRRQALGDGMMDAAVARRGESRRPANEQSPSAMELQRAKVVGRARCAGGRGRQARQRHRYRPDLDRLRAGLSRFPLRLRGLAQGPSEARPLVRELSPSVLRCSRRWPRTPEAESAER